MIKNQLITENYAAYESDCMYVLPTLPDASIDFSVYSPPFAGLYNYSSHDNDFSNCESREQFLEQYEFLIAEMARVTKPGRLSAVHCTDINTPHELWDFPHEIIEIHKRHGFKLKNRITVWKEPLKVRMRTMVKSLMHKLIVEDATECFTAMPDYVLIFRRDGENAVPVEHPQGLSEYFGEIPLLPHMLGKLLGENTQGWSIPGGTDYVEKMADTWKDLQRKYEGHKDPRTNKLSHYIWQRYASSVWDDVRIDNVLPFRDSKDEDDEKHVHPLQLDVIDRLVTLYTNPGEVVLSPFAGVGSEVYSPVSLGRKAIGIELKDTYYKQMLLNMEHAGARFKSKKQAQLF